MTLILSWIGSGHFTLLNNPSHNTRVAGINFDIFYVFAFHPHSFDTQKFIPAFNPDGSPSNTLKFDQRQQEFPL